MNKETLLSGWNFMRFLRLGLGIYIAVQAVETQSLLSGVVAVFFLFQAITNTGCCGANGCAVPIKKSNSDKIEELEYEEIK
jgi:hypothetical protein